MVEVKDIKIYDLEETIVASGFPMDEGFLWDNFSKEVQYLKLYLRFLNNPSGFDDAWLKGKKHFERALKLGNMESNSGHNTFLKGIRVSFNLKYTQYWTKHIQRYNFIDWVSSSSMMHKIDKIGFNDLDICDDFKKYLNSILLEYNEAKENNNKEKVKEKFHELIKNCPMGFILWARLSTNFLQLKNIFIQRKNHKLDDWKRFCNWIINLPYMREICFNNLEG